MLSKQFPLLRTHLLMVVCSVLVSTSFTVGAAITQSLDPAILTLIRFFVAAVAFAPWIYLHFGFSISVSFFLRCALISLCLVFFFTSMFLALRYTTALNTSVIFTLVPSMSCIYAYVIVRERFSRMQMIAFALGGIGVLWVIAGGDLGLLLTMRWNKGDLIFLGGCAALGLYTPLVKLLHRGEAMSLMTFWVLVSGLLWLVLLTGPEIFSIDFTSVPLKAWLGVVYLAIFTTVVSFFLTQYSVLYLGPTRVAAYSYLYPTFVLVLNFLLGHGFPPVDVLPGILIVLAAMVVILRVEKRQ